MRYSCVCVCMYTHSPSLSLSLMQVFGDIGRHARSAVGVSCLPFGVTTEVEAVVEASLN